MHNNINDYYYNLTCHNWTQSGLYRNQSNQRTFPNLQFATWTTLFRPEKPHQKGNFIKFWLLVLLTPRVPSTRCRRLSKLLGTFYLETRLYTKFSCKNISKSKRMEIICWSSWIPKPFNYYKRLILARLDPFPHRQTYLRLLISPQALNQTSVTTITAKKKNIRT